MLAGSNKPKKIVFLAVFLIGLTFFYSIFIHDLLAVRWQRFVDFFFYLVLMVSVFVLVKLLYQRHFKYLNLTLASLTNLNHRDFVELIAHLCQQMGYDKVRVIPDSFFDLTYESDHKKRVIFCYHQKRITMIPMVKNAQVILITDYQLTPSELEQLVEAHWQVIEREKLLRLLNNYLV